MVETLKPRSSKAATVSGGTTVGRELIVRTKVKVRAVTTGEATHRES